MEFRLPEGREAQTISIPAGAHNKYVFPACNRVWWDDLKFACSKNTGWKLAQGKYDADAYCTGTPGSSPYVAFGDR